MATRLSLADSKSSGRESSEEDENKDEIDVLSPNFNPLRALYSTKVSLPIADASCFNNLSEYEKFMKTGGERKQAPTLDAANATLLSKRAVERLRKQRNLEKEKELPKARGDQRKRTRENVLSHMYDTSIAGPLDLLRQCVEKRIKVRVCVRSFKGLRSVCIGYVVAFDKMFNMALMDVDEIYKRPSTGKRFHHEEKVTYSMIMSSLNQQKKKDPGSTEKTKVKGTKKKAKKPCQFCRIMHEAIQEQKVLDAKDEMHTSASEDESDSEYDSSDGDSSVESEGQSTSVKSDSDRGAAETCPNGHEMRSGNKTKQVSRTSMSGGKSKIDDQRCEHVNTTSKQRVEQRKHCVKLSETFTEGVSSSSSNVADSVPAASKLPESSTAKSGEGDLVVKSVTEQDVKSDEIKSKSDVQNTLTGKTTKVSTSSRSLSVKTPGLKGQTSCTTMSPALSGTSSSPTEDIQMTTSSSMEAAANEAATLGKPGATLATTAATKSNSGSVSIAALSGLHLITQDPSVSSSLTSQFSKTLTLESKGDGKKTTKRQKSRSRRKAKQTSEVVHLDPKTGKRLIQPEEFKRRHVNQLFLRGDNVVLVSVDSEMIVTNAKEPDAKPAP